MRVHTRITHPIPIMITERSALILLVGDLLHPLEPLSHSALLDSDMRHRSRDVRRPMLLTQRKPDHIAWPISRSVRPNVRPPENPSDDQTSDKRMYVPGCASTRLERDACATNTRGSVLEQRINAHSAGKPITRSFRRIL